MLNIFNILKVSKRIRKTKCSHFLTFLQTCLSKIAQLQSDLRLCVNINFPSQASDFELVLWVSVVYL